MKEGMFNPNSNVLSIAQRLLTLLIANRDITKTVAHMAMGTKHPLLMGSMT